jgi:hypothetical protein
MESAPGQITVVRSQFSREFNRLFGVTAVQEAEQTRSRLVAG